MKHKNLLLSIALLLVLSGCNHKENSVSLDWKERVSSSAIEARKDAIASIKSDSLQQAIKLLRMALNLSSDTEFRGLCMNNIGFVYDKLEQKDSTLIYYLRSCDLFKTTPHHLATAQLNTSITLQSFGLYELASEYAFAAKQTMENDTGTKSQIATVENVLGTIFMNVKDYSISLEYFKSSLIKRQKIKEDRKVASCINNIGNLYFEKGDYDSALSYFGLYLKKAVELRDIKKQARAFENIGKTYLELGSTKGWPFLDSAISLFEKRGSKKETLETKLLKSDYQVQDGKYVSLEEVYSLYQQAKGAGYNNYQVKALTIYAALNKHMGNYKDALLYNSQAQQLKDSFFGIQKVHQVYAPSLLYEREKRRRLKQSSDYNIHQLQLSRMVWVICAILAVMAALIGWWVSRRLKRDKLTIRKDKERIELLISELNHRIANTLSRIIQLLKLQRRSTSGIQAKELLESNILRIEGMGELYKHLYINENTSEVNLKDMVQVLAKEAMLGYGEKQIKLNLHIDPIILPSDQALDVGLIINELLSNSLKHAFKDSAWGNLQITIKQNGVDRIIEVRDDGTQNISQEKGTEFGLKMVKILVTNLGGKLEQFTEHGWRTRIFF